MEVEVTDGLTPGSYELKYEPKKSPKVSIILDIQNVEAKRAEQILLEVKKTTYSNYEIISISKENPLNLEKNILPEENANETAPVTAARSLHLSCFKRKHIPK